MIRLHDAGVGDAMRSRVRALTAETRPVWGRMSVDQMLHHVNLILAESLGEHTAERSIRGLPEWLIRWAIIAMPWGRGAPTRPDMKINDASHYDFAAEQERCLAMLDRFLARPMESAWPRSANFAMTGPHWSKLQFKHLNHHLTQFGV